MSRPPRLRLNWQDADTFINAVYSQRPVQGLTHNYYKYPARFSPEFARAAISVFSRPGDLVVDPFVGGGTCLVESRVLGRLGIGSDVSSLATFVTNAKTQRLSTADIEYLTNWFLRLPEKLGLCQSSTGGVWIEMGYSRNLQCEATWRIRKAIEIALNEISRIRIRRRQNFARCMLLRTAQWALDGRKQIPSIAEFRARIIVTADLMVAGAREYALAVAKADNLAPSEGRKRTICVNTRAEGLAHYLLKTSRKPPTLILSSPPYPGVHVLYHRWQVLGGKETPLPFWIANKVDGAGEAYYVMHALRENLSRYFGSLNAAYSALRETVSKHSVLITLVAFSDPIKHLPKYLDLMHHAGFMEYLLSDFVDSLDGRLWRKVPNRKWHATKYGHPRN